MVRRWKVVQLWSIPAETLLEAHDVGLIPWVPLTHFDGPPEPIFQQCRARIDEEAPPEERENLLAVTQVLAGLRYNEVGLFQLLGGRNAMIESPVIQELKAEWTREAAREAKHRIIVDVWVARFGPEAEEIATQLQTIADDARLKELVKFAAVLRRPPILSEGTRGLTWGHTHESSQRSPVRLCVIPCETRSSEGR